MLRYTGHPFVDVGVATICAMSNKKRPSEVTPNDLEVVATTLRLYYRTYGFMQNYISVIFLNPPLTQSSMPAGQRDEYADTILFAFRDDQPAEGDDTACTYFPELRAYLSGDRRHVPLFNGTDIANFSPMGIAGLPISGLALLALHAMPLGTLKCGQLLIFHQLSPAGHADGGMMMYRLTKRNWERNQRNINLLVDTSDPKMPSYSSAYRTRYVDELLHARAEIQERGVNLDYITGYYFTNYGPDPRMEILHLDNTVLDFINAAQQDAAQAWGRVVRRGWQTLKGEKEMPADFDTTTRRNSVYERMFGLPEQAPSFIHLLKPSMYVVENTKGQSETQIGGGSWELIEIFLRKVLLMEQQRIDLIRNMGDRLAEFAIKHTNQPLSFYYQFSRAKGYSAMLSVLRSASEALIKKNVLLFTYDEFVRVFEDGKDERKFWRLNRDLIAIRMMEQLHRNNVQITEDELPADLTLDINEDEEN